MTYPQLPPELLVIIIRFSISSFSSFVKDQTKQKQSLLSKLSQISKTFSGISQPLLFKEVLLNKSNIDLFLLALELRKSSGIQDEVKKIRFEFLRGIDGVGKVLEACKNSVKEVSCSLVEGVSLNEFSIVQNLTSLAFSNCSISFNTSSPSPYFPSLVNLSLNYVSLPLHQLTPLSLPFLKGIAIDEAINYNTLDCPISFLNRFCHLLTGLAIGDPSIYDPLRILGEEQINWGGMKELKVLSFMASAEWVLYPIGLDHGEGKGIAVRDFLSLLGSSKLKVVHFPYLRAVGFDPLLDFSSTSMFNNRTTTNVPNCLSELETVIYSLPSFVYSWSTILPVEKYSIEEMKSIKSLGEKQVGKRGEVRIEWEGEGMEKEWIDRRFFDRFWSTMEDLTRH